METIKVARNPIMHKDSQKESMIGLLLPLSGCYCAGCVVDSAALTACICWYGIQR